MEVLNYTGREIGIISKSGNPIAVLHPEGNPKVKSVRTLTMESDSLIPIYRNEYGRTEGLPSPDPNRETYYIVTEEVIRAVGQTRSDLLLPTEPFLHDGATYYRNLVLAS